MPELANPTLWRTKPQKVMGYLYVDDPPVVYSRRVNQSTFNYPMYYVEYDNPDANGGTHANVLDGMTIRVSSSSGVFKAFLRAKVSGDHQLLFGHVSRGECDFADNDILEVLDDYRPFAKIPFIQPDGTIRKDWDNYYSGENLNPPPIANAGVWYAGFINPTTVSVPFTPMPSFAVDDSGSISSQAWVFPGGTPSSATTANHAGVTFSSGRRWVLKTVTDNNGNTHTAKALVATVPRTGAGSPAPVTMAQLQGSIENGWTARFELLGTALTESDFPDGSPVIFFTEEKRGSTSGSLAGQAGREHVKFCGWIVGLDTTANSDGTSDLVIECAGPLAYMKTNPAFDQILERATTPADWQQMANLNWWKALIHWLYWHSTLLEITDIEQSPYYDALPAMLLPARAGSLYDQIQFICQATWGNFTCDKQGIFYARRWPQTMTDAEKSALDTIVDLGAADWTGEIRIGRTFRDKVGWLRAYMILASTTEHIAAASIAPGDTPGQGVSQDTLDQRLCVDQTDANTRSGRMFAYRNSDDEPISLRLMNMGGAIDPAWQEWVTLTLAAASNKRGISYSAARFWVSQTTITYDWRNGTSQETITIEKEVTGADGTTVNLPSEEDGTDVTAQDPPGWEEPPIFTPIIIGDGNDPADPLTGQAIAGGGPYVWVTFNRLNPLWDLTPDFAIFTAPSGHEVLSAVVDPRSPRILTGSGAVYMWVLTDNGGSGSRLYYSDNAIGGAFTLQQTFTHPYRILRAVRGVVDGIAGYGAPEDSPDAQFFFSDDAGDTVTETSLGVASSDSVERAAMDTDDHNLGAIVCGLNRYLFVTSTYTGTATQTAALWNGLDAFLNTCLVRIPYRRLDGSGALNNDPAALHFVIGSNAEDSDNLTLKRGTLNISTGVVSGLTDITPVVSANIYVNFGAESLETLASDPRVMLAGAYREGLLGSSDRILLSTDAGDTWTIPNNTLNLSTFVRWGNVGVNAAWLCGGVDRNIEDLYYTPDRATTFSDRRGNLAGQGIGINFVFPLE